MAITAVASVDLSPEPDLYPLYPNPSHIEQLLSPHSGLAPGQKAELVNHSLIRSCIFGDLSVLSYLLTDRQAQAYVDLSIRDEDGLGLVSLTIQGFGSESDRDVEREECVRLLIAQGADINEVDKAGWTPLHHAALRSTPTLVSHLMTHGCSLFSLTRRQLTALDIVTAHTVLPGREDVALLLEEAMRSEGWSGGRMEESRRSLDERIRRRGKQRNLQDDISRILELEPQWWEEDDSDSSSVSSESDAEDETEESIYTPSLDFSTMLVFSPQALPDIFDSVISSSRLSIRNAQPAKTLYLLARFACLTCDQTWLEDLIIGATDAIEERFFGRSEDITCLVFWLYNTTIWLHLMHCDNSINEACEMLGSFDLMEEIINSVFVFLIRYAERRIDKLLDAALLDYALSSDFNSVQFESEWSFLRPFSAKKKPPSSINSNGTPSRNGVLPSPSHLPSRPPSPSIQHSHSTSTPKGLSSLRPNFIRSKSPSLSAPLQSIFSDHQQSPSPDDLISFMTALHTLLTLSDINPALITQFWSQVIYWTSCEVFNRILTRKKYLCRSRAVQIGMNLSTIDEWIDNMGLPRGIGTHLTPVRDLLSWLQCLSSITDFSNLVATIQNMKNVNPLQMRRAVRDYKYEVNEGRMSDECVQYLTQLQKDWERHRVKMGVEALRKEIVDRGREREESIRSDSPPPGANSSNVSMTSETSNAQDSIDQLFDRNQDRLAWEPARPLQALGELLDSRYMLPLFLPSDPRMLAASARDRHIVDMEKLGGISHASETRTLSRASNRSGETPSWRSRSRKVRDVGVETLQWVDGARSAARWVRQNSVSFDQEDIEKVSYSLDDSDELRIDTAAAHVVPLTRKPSSRSKSRPSVGDPSTPIAHSDSTTS